MGNVILIGATTENPYFSVVSPLLSRSQIYKFEPLTEENIILSYNEPYIILNAVLKDIILLLMMSPYIFWQNMVKVTQGVP
jgi:replication-associated recombination protein RarA